MVNSLVLYYLLSEDIYRLSLKTGQTICRPTPATVFARPSCQQGLALHDLWTNYLRGINRALVYSTLVVPSDCRSF